jgi:hypothetical protein
VLLVTTAALVPIALLTPVLPGARLLGFVPIAPSMLLALVAITVAYVVAAELATLHFYRRAQAWSR